MFVIPHYDASHKGLDFILKLSRIIQKRFSILIVGSLISPEKLNKNIINFGYILSEELLNKYYRRSDITLVPTLCIESLGRVIIESLINKTPVITSPNCGAIQFFKKKDFLRVLPLKLALWKREIEYMSDNSPVIKDNDIFQIQNRFSLQKSKIDLLNIIRGMDI